MFHLCNLELDQGCWILWEHNRSSFKLRTRSNKKWFEDNWRDLLFQISLSLTEWDVGAQTVSSASHRDNGNVTIPKSNMRGNSNFMCIAVVINSKMRKTNWKMKKQPIILFCKYTSNVWLMYKSHLSHIVQACFIISHCHVMSCEKDSNNRKEYKNINCDWFDHNQELIHIP